MKNWIIVLLIFIMPLALYAYFDAKAQNEMMCKVEGNAQVKNPKAKIIKFSYAAEGIRLRFVIGLSCQLC